MTTSEPKPVPMPQPLNNDYVETPMKNIAGSLIAMAGLLHEKSKHNNKRVKRARKIALIKIVNEKELNEQKLVE